MKDNIILIAATNRPDILDPALLRPGRFDRQIVVDRPDRKGRTKILEVHTRGKPLAKAIELDTLAGQTPGFTGADLQNLVNEAALLAARQGKREIDHLQLEEGIMRVIAGPEKKTRVMSEKERRVTAFHEMGHALVAHYLHNTDPVHKISVISRGQALGYTISLPTEDKFLTTRAELNDTMAMTLGGRAAEEIVFSEVTTGASNDLEKVTATAKQMVMRFGMSEKLGPRVFGHDHGQPFLGREFSSEPDYSDEIAREIDDEIRRIVEEAHQSARDDPRAAPDEARDDLRDPAAPRDDRARAVHRAARGQDRGRGLRTRGAARADAAAGGARGAGAQARAGAEAAAAARAGGREQPRCARPIRPSSPAGPAGLAARCPARAAGVPLGALPAPHAALPRVRRGGRGVSVQAGAVGLQGVGQGVRPVAPRRDRPLSVSLKCEPELAERLRATYAAVRPGYHLNKRHWNTVEIDGSIPDRLVLDMIEDSYDLVVAGLPKRVQAQLGWPPATGC